MADHGLSELPDEILLNILSFLDPFSISRLQLVSRKCQKLCLDDKLWRSHSFEASSWYHTLLSRRANRAYYGLDDHTPGTAEPGSDSTDAIVEDQNGQQKEVAPLTKRSQRRQDIANWDPTFPDEKVSWYDEYIQRQGPTCVNWLQSPRLTDRGSETFIEVRGLTLYNPYDGHDGVGSMLAVSPLEDGSVCLWDVNGSRGRQGAIVSRSRPGTLFGDRYSDDSNRRSKTIDTSVNECVSVDSDSNKAFFAVQSRTYCSTDRESYTRCWDVNYYADLLEVDLNRLEVVSRESFEWSITTLSSVHAGVPLTVGTSLGIHLYDFRARLSPLRQHAERLDGSQWDDTDALKSIFDTKPLPPYASLSQPTPISILHLPQPGSSRLVSDDIYVSGRFSNILHYDRRKFPAIAGSIYSGGIIKSLAALPYPFSAADYELRRNGEMSAESVSNVKQRDGRTIVAGGSYKQKGSLEIYGLSPRTDSGSRSMLQSSLSNNRVTAASSSILSVINHGTKIAFSDGAGLLKWFERDGRTECRSIKIGHSDMDAKNSLFAEMPASDDIARKIVSTKSEHGSARPNSDNILFWTGEKLGLVSFTTEPLYREQDFVEADQWMTLEDQQRAQYRKHLHEALERQADEARFLSRLDLGSLGP